MENTSLSTLQQAEAADSTLYLNQLTQNGATASDYHGVDHPSLPNYIALTSGDTQGVGCDCSPVAGNGSCNFLSCNLLIGSCSCDQSVTNLADEIEAANLDWRAYGEDMGANTPCNLTDSGNYAVRHLPFLYYDDIQNDPNRCNSHVIDFQAFANDLTTAPKAFSFIAPNLIDDMHNPDPTTSQNIPDGSTWLSQQVPAILSSQAYLDGGLLVIVWDEDDGSGGITGSDDPIPMFVFSPYARSGGYVSSTTANHYSLLATFEDGLGLARLGQSANATPLTDFFPQP
jgi:hypothetical protein